jgi:hypothetical protein
MIKLYMDDGAPWNFPAWKELTGVTHGLFPDDDTLLPRPWNRQDALDIQSYFNQYHAVVGEDAKIRFAVGSSGSAIPGRTKWNSWINKNWTKWNINSKISTVLRSVNIHPLDLLGESPLNEWPVSTGWIPIAVNPTGAFLFGLEAINPNTGHLSPNLRAGTQILIQRTWLALHSQAKRNEGKLASLEKAAISAFSGAVFLSSKMR